VVLALAVLFVALGFWQLDRHHDARSAERARRAALAAPAPDLASLARVEPGRRVSALGRYDARHQALLRNRVRDGTGGYDVLTPLVTDHGTVVLVDRGFVGRAELGATLAERPTGRRVTVFGIARRSRRSPAGDQPRSVADHPSVAEVDLALLGDLLDHRFSPTWIELQAERPDPPRGAPRPAEPDPGGAVDHLAYALQWWAFAAILAVGWPLWLRQSAGRHRPNRPVTSPSPGTGGPDPRR
jgi:cytochrome oxidase assembly protein ShyY1